VQKLQINSSFANLLISQPKTQSSMIKLSIKWNLMTASRQMSHKSRMKSIKKELKLDLFAPMSCAAKVFQGKAG
jgi:hypothetical protein